MNTRRRVAALAVTNLRKILLKLFVKVSRGSGKDYVNLLSLRIGLENVKLEKREKETVGCRRSFRSSWP